jgi:membrane protein DedA with SNARE-associated domain
MFEFIGQFWAALSSGAILPGLGYWSYLLIALLVAVEGSVATLVAAALAGVGMLNPWLVFASASIGNATADAGWYWLGRLERFDALAARLPWLHRFEPQVAQIRRTVRASGLRLYVVTKLFLWPAVIPTLIAAGMARVPWPKMILVSAVSETIWTGCLVLIGLFLGNYLSQLKSGLEWVSVGLGGVAVIALIYYIGYSGIFSPREVDH